MFLCHPSDAMSDYLADNDGYDPPPQGSKPCVLPLHQSSMYRLGSLYSTAAAELFEKSQTAGCGSRYCPYGVWLMRPDGRLLLPAIYARAYLLIPREDRKASVGCGEQEARGLGCHSMPRLVHRCQMLFPFRRSRAKGRKTHGSSLGLKAKVGQRLSRISP